MSGTVLVLLFLISVGVKASQKQTCQRRGPLNMTFVVNTLNQVINPSELTTNSQEDSTEDVSGFTQETRQAIQNITDTLNQAVSSYGPRINAQEEVLKEIRSFTEETNNAIQNVTGVRNQVSSQEEVMNDVTGLTNETRWAVDTLTHVVKTQVVEEVRGFVKETKEAMGHITDTLAHVVKSPETIQNLTEFSERMIVKQEQIQRELAQLQRDVTFIKSRISKSTCSEGVHCYNGSCYTTDVTPRTWDEARKNCRSQGRDLVSIETAEENEFLKSLMSEYSSVIAEHIKKDDWFGFWTSGSDEDKEGTYIWKATGSNFSYVNWHEGQPNNYGRKQHLVFITNLGLWNDTEDNKKYFSFCECSSN